ncbi:alpha/beta hydrolase [Altericroceibacterium spongiae]|uniref:Alpha/beta hydrolase n=1 Tax=Altericroceibacterium spongiae TaxID=2320269 RepID=A0A420EM11_9SPHN|nr:alpha/beta hydrolase [Altericroceibacterium spongiae]RKF21757.1 alpha/beta hydrolase [Altericroceibacterium spongiae]
MHKNVNIQGVHLESPTKKRLNHGQYPCNGSYYSPEGERPTTAIIASHYVGNWANHYLGEYMARRGYGFLGWNSRFAGASVASGFNLEHALIDLGVGVRWLREEAGVEKVVILGHSGGASLMGAYQAQALDPHIDPGSAPEEELNSLLPADFYISLAAHPGRAKVFTEWLDPSVTDENDPLSYDPELDMYNPDNGPPYSPEWLERYRAAQVARNERITQWAEKELQRIGDGRPQSDQKLDGAGTFGVASKNGVFDRFFVVPRQFADPRFLDLTIEPSKRKVGCYMGDPQQSNYSGYGLAPITSAREWLAMWSLSKTQVRIEEQLPRITQPALVIYANHDQGVFPSHAQAIYEALGSADKRLISLDGAHYFEELGSRAELANLLANWLEDHEAPAV